MPPSSGEHPNTTNEKRVSSTSFAFIMFYIKEGFLLPSIKFTIYTVLFSLKVNNNYTINYLQSIFNTIKSIQVIRDKKNSKPNLFVNFRAIDIYFKKNTKLHFSHTLTFCHSFPFWSLKHHLFYAFKEINDARFHMK